MGALYRRGIIMNLTNPKIAIFFLAFLPQFTNPNKGNMTGQLFTAGPGFYPCCTGHLYLDCQHGWIHSLLAQGQPGRS